MNVPSILVPAVRRGRGRSRTSSAATGETHWTAPGALRGVAADGSTVTVGLPYQRTYEGLAAPLDIAEQAQPPDDWGILLVRKGGFAVARMAGSEVHEHKIGQRHVQGRTKAGGQSQQRFARRRDNQARQAYEAAADHAARLLGESRDLLVVTGGDRAAVAEVLSDPRLARLRQVGPVAADPGPASARARSGDQGRPIAAGRRHQRLTCRVCSGRACRPVASAPGCGESSADATGRGTCAEQMRQVSGG